DSSHPVLSGPKVASGALVTSDPSEQLLVDLPDQPEAEGQLSEPAKTAVHGSNVVHYLVHVVSLRDPGTCLELQEISQRGLRPLNLGAEDRLLPDVHAHEEVRVGQDGRGSFQLSQGEVRPAERSQELTVQPQRR